MNIRLIECFLCFLGGTLRRKLSEKLAWPELLWELLWEPFKRQRASCALYGRGYGKWNFEGILKALDARFVAIPGRLAFSLSDSSLHGQRGRCPSHFFTLTLTGGATGISWGSFDERCRKCWPRLELCGDSGGSFPIARSRSYREFMIK